jgi:acyl-CoA thioesterase
MREDREVEGGNMTHHKSHEPERACHAIVEAVHHEPYANKLGIRCVAVEPGYCRVEMTVTEDMMNVFGIAHGGAVFSVIDEAFQIACNSHGMVALALNLSVTYVAASNPGDLLTAEARETALTSRTGTYHIRVTREDGTVVALAQALAYRKKEPLPFL